MLPRSVIRAARLIASAGGNTVKLSPVTWWRIELHDALLVLDRVGSGRPGERAAAHRCGASHSLSALLLGGSSAGCAVDRRRSNGLSGECHILAASLTFGIVEIPPRLLAVNPAGGLHRLHQRGSFASTGQLGGGGRARYLYRSDQSAHHRRGAGGPSKGSVGGLAEQT